MNTAILLLWLAICALQDVQKKRISNWLTFGGIAFALFYLLLRDQSLLGYTAVDAFIAAGFAVLLSLPGYMLNKLGAADLKLLLFIGLCGNSQILLITIAAAGIFLLAWAAAAQNIWPTLSRTTQERLKYLQPHSKSTYPYGLFLFGGFLTSLILTKTF
ncbi:prepilin peptidase [Pseudomonas segetis]|uniref:Prepilin peptidase CpaA n=1 Tax=Pseudomonas segetis TaxID=298908 RepID=A0A239DAT0_9PSED|nr:prepilin peptidase [Pseudomonas segetis]SNS29420.1 prepilin peptidase CpaA [Pseudomonas segetis]